MLCRRRTGYNIHNKTYSGRTHATRDIFKKKKVPDIKATTVQTQR